MKRKIYVDQNAQNPFKCHHLINLLLLYDFRFNVEHIRRYFVQCFCPCIWKSVGSKTSHTKVIFPKCLLSCWWEKFHFQV